MTKAEQVALDEVVERAFDRKRANFIEDYELRDKPALIWQAWSTENVVLDISNEPLREAIRRGGGDAAEDAWWYGFKTHRSLKLVFDGIASVSDSDGPGWATETHVDGQVSAAVWKFPTAGESGASTSGVADFYVDAFRDFAFLTSRVYEASGGVGSVQLTATMHHADKLSYFSDNGRVVLPGPRRKTLRWPTATVAVADLMGAGSAMAAQFMLVDDNYLGRSTTTILAG